MKKFLFGLVTIVGVAWIAAPTQAQTCPPGQTGNPAYCQVAPPPPVASACADRTSKLSLLRATFNRADRTISIFAPITRRASGKVRISLRGASRTTTFTAPIDSQNGYVRVTRRIPAAQARLGTGILTIRYDGDEDTRAQVVRLRAANNPADLSVTRPEVTATGFLRASGRVTSRARGLVRVQLEYVNRADGETVTLERSAPIRAGGRWSVNSELSPSIRGQIARRCGTLHSYTLFTGFMPPLIRGEMKAFQVLPKQ